MYDHQCSVEGGESVPKSPSGRTLVSAFWLFSIVLVGTYSGNLIAFLTVPLDKPPFNSLDEMIAQSEYKWGTIGASFYVTWFNVRYFRYIYFNTVPNFFASPSMVYFALRLVYKHALNMYTFFI